MSKSKGNVIKPDDVVKEYGGDTLRTYELFMGPFEQEKPWSTTGIVGARRFLEKVWRLSENLNDEQATDQELKVLHRAIAKVSEEALNMRFNTAIASLMEAINEFASFSQISKETYLEYIKLINPFAPHITEELWQMNGGVGYLSLAAWPIANQKYLTQDQIELPIQINGKIRDKILVSPNLSDEQVLKLAKESLKVAEQIKGKELLKEIVVPGRLISLVIK